MSKQREMYYKEIISTAAKNLKKNFPLLLSTVSVLCLFSSPSPILLLMIVAILVTVVVFVLLDKAKPPAISNRLLRLMSTLIAMLIMFMGYFTFITTWMQYDKVVAFANTLQLTAPILLSLVGVLGCVVGFYAIYVLSCWIVNWGTQLLQEKLPVQKKTEIVANLKRNWYFPISAMAFFCLNATLTLGYFVGLLIAFVISILIASQIPSLFNFAKQNCKWNHAVAIMTALGSCWEVQSSFYAAWSISPKVQALKAMLPISIDIPGIVSVFGAVVAVFFIYFCVLIFWKEMTKIISNNGIFDDVNIPERIVYSILIIASAVFVVLSFAQTEVFYGTEHDYDIIYTSDSPSLVKGNVYLTLTHTENDLRQPLFAVFATPFVGIPYLLAKLLGVSESVQPMLINMVQVVMLFAANFMLSKMMRLSPLKRICFMLLASCTYTHLLFTLMMEQYIIAYFWLIFCIYLISENQWPDRIALWGAGGTLLTSMVLMPFMSDKNPVRNFKEWFDDIVKFSLEFIALILVFCRFDVIFNFSSKVSALSGYTGRNITLMDKIHQYIYFIKSCFFAPDAGVDTTSFDHISWQLNPVTSMSFVGLGILILVIVSAILNRDKKSSLLTVGWVAFSVVMLLVLGWGTKENGLILYALYFGWAFLVLLFQLVEKIEDKLNVKFLVPAFSIMAAIVLIAINIPAIMEMVNFAITYYPT